MTQAFRLENGGLINRDKKLSYVYPPNECEHRDSR